VADSMTVLQGIVYKN